jgi:hypothetical protein
MADELEAARRELDEEFAQVRKSMQKVREQLEAVERLGPQDDLFGALDDIEDTVKKARTGGLVGGGAKGHRKALEKFRSLQNG